MRWETRKPGDILEGIKIFQHKRAYKNPRDRICLSKGSGSASGEAGYHPRALLPAEPWYPPDSDAVNLLFAGEPSDCSFATWNPQSSIAVVKLSGEGLEDLQADIRASLHAARFEPLSYLEFIRRTDATKLNPLVAALCDELPFELSRLQFLRVHTAHPGLKTLTQESKNPDQALLMGLHLDSVDAEPRAGRHRARSRLCINIGAEPRHFLFINQTLEALFEALPPGERTQISKYFRGNEVGYEFLARYPDYPVVRLTLDPGECYIAPTDNILHDASTLEKSYVDISLHLLGHFRLR